MRVEHAIWLAPNESGYNGGWTGRERFIPLTGIVVRVPRPGWLTMEILPLEAWELGLRWLTQPQRERIDSPEFYKLIQEQATRRYLDSKTKTP